MFKLPQKTILLLYALFFGSNLAHAVPVTWTLSGVTFDDGGTATGSFVFDADLGPEGQFLSINITTSGGCIPGTAYVGPNAAAPGNVGVLFAFENTDPPLAGQTYVALAFTSVLSNLGGTVPVNAPFSGEIFILDSVPASVLPLRLVTAGVVSSPDGGSSFLLGVLGFGAVALLCRKKSGPT